MGQEKEGLSEDSGITFFNMQIKYINNWLAFHYLTSTADEAASGGCVLMRTCSIRQTQAQG